MNQLDDAIETLAARFTDSFPERAPQLRTIGREAEFPVVTATGQAADVRRLWEPLLTEGDLRPHYDTTTPNLIVGLDGDDYNYELEVGLGTVEIVVRPCTDLFTVQTIMDRAVRRLVYTAARYQWQILAYGIQPVSPPSLPLMAPKQRYQSLYRAMGAEWLWYTVTASDQCHVAIGRDETVLMLNFGNLMAPVLIALCANSPVHSGALSPFCSAREGQHLLIDLHQFRQGGNRHGMPVRPFTSIADYVRTMAQSTYLIVRADNEIIPSSRPFTDYVRKHGPDFAAFLFHEHYIWNSARLRTSYGTIEIRPACQQPWPEHMAAMALSVGLIEAAEPIMDYVQTSLGADYWTLMRTYHRQVIEKGLAAPQPAPDFLRQIVLMAEEGLRARRQSEEVLLKPIFDRLDRRLNPAQRARGIFQSDGMAGLLAHTAIRPHAIR
jgi:gamma-glutamylcysteine synthetase